MPTISTRVSETEYSAILEYANACGVGVSEFIRRALMSQILFLPGGDADVTPQYALNLQIEDDGQGDDLFERFTNKFRKQFGVPLF